MKYFRKDILQNVVYVGAHPVKWNPCGENQGVLALDETNPKLTALIEGLEGLIKAKRGGVIDITREEYEELKKKPFVAQSRRESFNHQGIQSRSPIHSPESPASGGAAAAEPATSQPSTPEPRKRPVDKSRRPTTLRAAELPIPQTP